MSVAVLKAKDVMEKYSLSRGAVMVLFHTKGFPSYKIGNQWFVEDEEMVEYLKKQSEEYKG